MKRMWSRKELKQIVNQALASGAISEAKLFEAITDKDNHKRFIEGAITAETIEGVTQTYGKWSLSGSHLLIIIAGTVADGTVFSGTVADLVIPKWIYDKVIPVVSNLIYTKNYNLFGTDLSTQSTWTALYKQPDNKLRVSTGNLTLSANRNFRIEHDILIDNADA